MAKGKLTAKQEQFCQEYLVDLNATQAYIRAGYTKKGAAVSACKLLTIPKVQAQITQLKAKRNKRTQIDQDWVISRLVKLTERCMQEEQVLDKDGNPTGEYRFDSAGANSALDKLGKNVGIYLEDNKQKSIEIQTAQVSRQAAQDAIRNRMSRLSEVYSGQDTGESHGCN